MAERVRLDELTWREAERVRDAIVLVPVGSTEAHGPHLPLATDVHLSEEVARRSVPDLAKRGYRSLIAPTIPYAVTEYAAPFCGTVSIAAETAIALYGDVCLALQRQGFARVCLVNTHLEPAHVEALREACRRVVARGGQPVAFPDQMEKRWARTLGDEYKRGECHAGSYETSLLLAAPPAVASLVRDERRSLPRVPINLAHAMRDGKRTFVEAGADAAYFGDPAAATAAEGETLYARLVEMVVTVVAEVWG